jgi:Ni,Fe-hydrogenase I cytochrome b subunit
MVTKRQKEILIGTILGDGYLQKTGKRNARLKLEHSERQRDYLWWKYEQLRNLMQDKPKRIERYNPIWKRTYVYYRCQSRCLGNQAASTRLITGKPSIRGSRR